MFGREADALRRHQIAVGIVWFGQVCMHCLHHLIGGVRAANSQHLGMRLQYHVALGTQTAGDDNFAVLRQRFADGVQRFLHRTVDKTAGVNHHQIGVGIAGGNKITFGAQPGEDVL